MTPDALADLVRSTAADVLVEHDLDTAALPTSVRISRPRDPRHGDYTSPIALQIASQLDVTPRDLAGWMAHKLTDVKSIATAEVAGDGFLNVRLTEGGTVALLQQVLGTGEAWGHTDVLAGSVVNVVSSTAGPVGPIHLGGARWAAVGDALGRVLAAQGAAVTREYYVNDAGAQIDRFAESLQAAARGEAVPENGYGGAYVGEVAAKVLEASGGSGEGSTESLLDQPGDQQLAAFKRLGVEVMLDEMRASLEAFGTHFDVWSSELALHASGAVEESVRKLKDDDALYPADGAWWLRSTDSGDDKDRVVIKSDGRPAYIAGDIAYYRDKRARGADLAIYMLGADHHGYIHRLKAVAVAFGDDPARVEVLIGQLVNLVRGGEPVRMSKRAGTIVTLEDLVDAVGVDAARYSLVRSSVDQVLEIDLDLVSSRTSENPVFSVQYAHARLASLARNAADLGVPVDQEPQLELLTHPREGDLIRTLGEYPRVLSSASSLREPHRVARYLEELAGAYHRFYDTCRVLPQGDEVLGPMHVARLALCRAARQVLANGLGLLGVGAPERM